ncbi:MAG: SAM-dependent methyltransferase [Gemmataceae bacterium]
MSDQAEQLIRETIRQEDFRRATFAGVVRGAKACPWQRVLLRAIVLRGKRYLQFSYFDMKQNYTYNFCLDDPKLNEHVDQLLAWQFAGVHLSTTQEEIDLRTSKKGKVQIGRRRKTQTATPLEGHNRSKAQPLPEGQPHRLLEIMGITTPDGRVKPTMRPKFTQINEFLKLVQHSLDEAGLRNLGRPVELLDCGCGSSYLTLAVHHYLNEQLGIEARIMGVDLNESVIRKSMERSARCGATGVQFAVGRIDATQTRPDVVLALHACDTATDEALALAVRAEARAILSVPCCHHYLNERLKPQGQASVLRPVLRHGILHQRQADLFTDAFRALILRILGYRAEVIEFISPEATARNLMIRAVGGLPPGDPTFVAEYQALRAFCGTAPYLEQRLGERLLRWISSTA